MAPGDIGALARKLGKSGEAEAHGAVARPMKIKETVFYRRALKKRIWPRLNKEAAPMRRARKTGVGNKGERMAWPKLQAEAAMASKNINPQIEKTTRYEISLYILYILSMRQYEAIASMHRSK